MFSMSSSKHEFKEFLMLGSSDENCFERKYFAAAGDSWREESAVNHQTSDFYINPVFNAAAKS